MARRFPPENVGGKSSFNPLARIPLAGYCGGRPRL